MVVRRWRRSYALSTPDPIRDATEIALTTVRDFLLSDAGKPIELVVYCIHSNRDLSVYEETTPTVFPPTDEQAAEEQAAATEDTASVAAEAETSNEGDAPVAEHAKEATPAAEDAPTPVAESEQSSKS